MSGIMHKVKDALTGDKDTTDTTTATGTQGHHPTATEHTAGAHSSNATHANIGGTGTGTGTGTGMGTGTGTDKMGTGYGHATTGTTTAGPHSSSFGNKADPRVDSNLGMIITQNRPLFADCYRIRPAAYNWDNSKWS